MAYTTPTTRQMPAVSKDTQFTFALGAGTSDGLAHAAGAPATNAATTAAMLVTSTADRRPHNTKISAPRSPPEP